MPDRRRSCSLRSLDTRHRQSRQAAGLVHYHPPGPPSVRRQQAATASRARGSTKSPCDSRSSRTGRNSAVLSRLWGEDGRQAGERPADAAATRGGMRLFASVVDQPFPTPTFDEVRPKGLTRGDSGGAASPRQRWWGSSGSSHRCGSRFHSALGGHFALEAAPGQFATTVGRRCPDLGKEVLVAVAIEKPACQHHSYCVHPNCR